jgi:tRNA dimethylallyltransferase
MTDPKKKPTLIAIIGPTACGKTEAALSMARQHNGAVVSADSRQVYVGMNVGTAKPEALNGALHDELTADPIAGIDHYLFNIREPNDELTLAEWRKAAYAAIDSIIDQNQLPIVAGGTMLYTDSIVNNYTLPAVPADQEFRTRKHQETTAALYQELVTADPDVKEFIEPANKRRIIRALEVIAATGQPFSAQRKQQPPLYEVTVHGVFPGWSILESRIRDRVTTMLDQGLLAEVQRLIDKHGATLPLLQTINYAQALQVINGELDVKAAPAKMVQANLRYARRQMKWWKRYSDISWHNTASDLSNSVTAI